MVGYFSFPCGKSTNDTFRLMCLIILGQRFAQDWALDKRPRDLLASFGGQFWSRIFQDEACAKVELWLGQNSFSCGTSINYVKNAKSENEFLSWGGLQNFWELSRCVRLGERVCLLDLP